MVEHTIDLQSLEIKPQSPNYSYIGLDENNELVRTKIELSSGGGEAFANIVERTCYLTSVSWYFDENGQPNEEEIEIIEITEEQRAYNIETYEMAYGDNVPLLTHSGGFFEMSSGEWNPSEGTGEVSFSRVIGDTMLLNRIAVMSININHNGDADAKVKLYDFYSKDEIDYKLENLVVGDVDLSNYYTKSEMDEYIQTSKENRTNIEYLKNYKQNTLISGTNIKTINGKSILGEGDITIEGGSGDEGGANIEPDSYIVYLPETYIEETFTIDTSEVIDTIWHMYEDSAMMEHNRKVIQAINEGKAKSVYLQRIREYSSVYDWENNTYTNKAIFMYVPIQFRPKNEIVDSYTRVYGYYAISEDDYNLIYLVGYNFEDNGSAYITIDRSYEIENGGGSGGGDYGSNPTFDSITVNGGAYFNSEIVMAGGGQSDESDIASMIACAFKAGKTQSIDQWTRNIHCGTDGQGLRVCSSDEGGETQYMAVDTDCNIYEGTTKLSDKYALKSEIGGGGGEPIDLSNYYTKTEVDEIIGDINYILTSI